MQSRTFVPIRDVWQFVSRFDVEFLVDFHVFHRAGEGRESYSRGSVMYRNLHLEEYLTRVVRPLECTPLQEGG